MAPALRAWTKEGVGAAAREIRDDLHMTVRELATITGVSHTHISNVEAGKFKHLPEDYLEALAIAHGEQRGTDPATVYQFLIGQRPTLLYEKTLRPRSAPVQPDGGATVTELPTTRESLRCFTQTSVEQGERAA